MTGFSQGKGHTITKYPTLHHLQNTQDDVSASHPHIVHVADRGDYKYGSLGLDRYVLMDNPLVNNAILPPSGVRGHQIFTPSEDHTTVVAGHSSSAEASPGQSPELAIEWNELCAMIFPPQGDQLRPVLNFAVTIHCMPAEFLSPDRHI